ncbi:ParB/RepB/Spo0J family partition protein [Rothia nasimurium]|uniref:ParB/RepB/Spo0J family partition protein n=1 Tax=Rothia nasimurium TaxID=85336 RepID=UPI003622F5C8
MTMILKTLQTSQCFNNPNNMRASLGAPEELDKLAANIRIRGIIQPLVVTDHPTRNGDYILIAGHRRLAAAKKAGLTEVPAIYTDQYATDGDQLAAIYAENVHRESVTAVEEARHIQKMLDLPGYTDEKASVELSRSVSTIRRRRQLLKADQKVLDAIANKTIDLFKGEEISKYTDEPDLAEKLTTAAESGDDWRWKSAVANAEATLNWRQSVDKVYDHLTKLGYSFLEAAQTTDGTYRFKHPAELPSLSNHPTELLALTSRCIPADILKEHGKDGLRPYLNHNSQRVDWFVPAPSKNSEKPEPTPEELAEQEAREKVNLALRVEHPRFKEHLETLAGQPSKLKGTAHGALVEVICDFGYELPDMLTLLNIEFDPNEPNKGEAYRDAITSKSLDQLAYALFMVNVIGIGNQGTNDLYTLNRHNPSGLGRYTNRKLNALETIYGIEPSDAIKQARAYWEPALPGTDTTTRNEVNF